MTDLWDELDLSDFSFHSEVMDACGSAIIDSRIWSGGGPGLSGIWYVVLSTNRALLHKELREGILSVILRKQQKDLQPPPPPKVRRKTAKRKTQ
jgi:hypothetical protein